VLVQRFAFRDVHSLTLGFGPGQRVRIEWSRARVTHKNPAKQLTFSVLPLHVADEIVGTIHRLYPLPRPPPIEEDAQTPRVIREKATAAAAAAAAARASSRPRLPPPRAQLLNAETETVRLYLLIEVVNLATGRLLPRAAVVSSSTLYVFVESPEYFLVRPTETRRPRRCRFGPTPPSVSQVEPLITAKEKRSKRKDGARLLREEASFRWDALLEVDFLAGDQVAPHAAWWPRSGRTHLRKKHLLRRAQAVVALRFTSGSTQLRFGDDFALSLFKVRGRVGFGERGLGRGVSHALALPPVRSASCARFCRRASRSGSERSGRRR
jgi:hypothetical protein